MKVKFTGAYYHRTEEKGFKISYLNGKPEYVLLHFYSPMIIILDGKRYETQSNACILYTPETPQIYWSKSGTFDNDYIKFLPEENSFFDEFEIPQNKIFYVEDFDVIRNEMRDITFFMTERQENYDDELVVRLKSVLHKLEENRVSVDKKLSHKNDKKFLLSQIRKKVESNPENWTVDLMAENCFVTRSYFSILYKQTFGVSPQSDIHKFLNDKAIRLISTTNWTVQKIAETLNYNECENFIRAFKKTNGISPLQFRKKILQIT